MKLPLILPALVLPALLAPALHAQTALTGNVSSLSLSLTVNETIGGNKLTDAQVAKLESRGTDINDFIQYDIVFSSNPASNIRNPSGWDLSKGNNYVERVVNNATADPQVVTAYGSHKIHKTRYTNATLLADLVAAGRIPATKGYRLVAVRFNLPNAPFDYVHNNGTYSTAVNGGLYFFAEGRAGDPIVFLGAEDDEYDYSSGDHAKLIDFESYETADAGKYVDVFTGSPNGWIYTVSSDSYKGVSLAEVSLYRTNGNPLSYYEIRVGGIFSWAESYNRRLNTYVRGAIAGKNLAGPANTYVATDTNGDSVTDTFEPSGLYEGVASGSVKMGSSRHTADLTNLARYLDQIPPVPVN